jgi:methyl-accepting chemotaxis protein
MTISSLTISSAQSAPPDTIAVLASPGFLSTVETVSTIVLAVAVLGAVVVLLLVLFQLRKLAASLTTVARRVEKDSAPIIHRARSVAENVEFITMAVRTDVQKLNASISGLNDRLKEASARMEERIQDFNALVDVLQEEAEALALDTAAAVRGVRAGTRNLAGEGASESPSQVEPDSLSFRFPPQKQDEGSEG